MSESVALNFQLFSDNLRLFNSILSDIENAKKYIYIETFKYGNDAIGIKYRDTLLKKRKQGVEVKLLIDAWGASVGSGFFSNLIKAGGEIRFFKKLVWGFDFFTKNHKRDHRKLVIIDDEISYIGSANFTDYSINWRELNLKLTGSIARPFKKVFFENYEAYNKNILNKLTYEKLKQLRSIYARVIRHKGFEIVRDIPSTFIQPIKKKYVRLIKKAGKRIIIETPYFLPSSQLRKALIDAANMGVEVTVIVPKHSDVRLIDILRNKYLGLLHKNNISILYYVPQNLHAKLLFIDDEVFSIGSANFDYRSFRFLYEVCLIGRDEAIISALQKHIAETMQDCEAFDYNNWLKRSKIEKFFESLLVPFRHLF